MTRSTVTAPSHAGASESLLCADDPRELRRRYEHAHGPARQWMDRLIWTARHADVYSASQMANLGTIRQGTVRPTIRPDERAYSALAYLLTGDAALAAITRERLLALADSVAERETTDTTQNHCWCDAFGFARWIVFYDWVHDSGAFSAPDHDRLAERSAYYIWAHPYQRLRARAIEGSACNNQNAAMAFACAVGGYVFGLHRRRDRHLARACELGIDHLVRFLTAFPRGGYSYEGSTYMGKVNAAVIPLALEAVRHITGVDLLDARADGACATPREVLESIMRLMSPAGLLLPWDNYGYELAGFTPAAAYLARRTGNDAGLQLLTARHLLHWPEHAGWGFDNSLWALLYLPEDFEPRSMTADDAARLFNHAEPAVGAGAAGPGQRLYAYQMWDRSNALPVRQHFNPNALVMEYDGAPLLIDGWCVEHAKAAVLAAPRYRRRKPDTGNEVTIGRGTVGAHNTIFLDDEPHYASPRATEGTLIGACYESGAALFEADVTDCFRDRYDVRRVRRSTLVLDDELVFVRDRIVSDSEHKVSWRAHVRDGDVSSQDHACSITTPEGVRLDVCVPEGATLEQVHHEGDSDTTDAAAHLEGRCHELNWHDTGRDVTLTTLLVPTATRQARHDLSAGWEWRRGRDDAEADQWLASTPASSRAAASNNDQTINFAHGRDGTTPAPGLIAYRRELVLEEAPAGPLWLKLPRLLGSARVRINDADFHVGRDDERQMLVPEQVEISGALRQGTNVLAIVMRSLLDWEPAGEVGLYEPAPATGASRLVKVDEHTFDLHHHGQHTRVAWNETGCTLTHDDGRTTTLRLEPPPTPNVTDHTTSTRAIDAATAAVKRKVGELVEPATAEAAALARAITDADWRSALAALEDAEGRDDPAIVQAAWQRLCDEHASHPTPFARAQEDVCWYRLKAACARVLGAARYEPAVPLLGEILAGEDFYPARAMCAQALGRIGTPAARQWLEQVQADEHNTQLHAERALRAIANQAR
ncbi:MAG: HEAT repeat domain-containing protein [Phycisphaeraceae bacterium]